MYYRTIDGDVSRRLRAERVAALEAEHYRIGLLIEEGDSGEHAATLSDLERRIAGHLAVLEPTTGADDADSSEPDGGGHPRNGAAVDLETVPAHG